MRTRMMIPLSGFRKDQACNDARCLTTEYTLQLEATHWPSLLVFLEPQSLCTNINT